MRDPREGDQIGRYLLERPVDRGAYGRVWRARHVDTGQTVAIKMLAPQSGAGAQAAARADLERLAAAAARESDHIVRVLASGQEPVPYLVMEFVAGTNLREELARRGQIPQEEVIRIGLAVADALLALHRVRIIHRDVKPANILLDTQGEVKLTDFGIAKILGYEDTVTVTDQAPLSAPYAAPEVWDGTPVHQSDIYALGAVLFELLAGRPPFRGEMLSLYRQHRFDEPDLALLPPDTVPMLRELVYLCLRKTPEERAAGAEACSELLLQARNELRKEPDRFGPWLTAARHESRPWTWRCRHERSGEEATVEVHFAMDESLGEDLRNAVAVNADLAPLGAERLLGTNRLLLGDDEGWPHAPAHNVVFWVARQEIEPGVWVDEVDGPLLGRVVDSLSGLIDAAERRGLRLSLDEAVLALDEDGSVRVIRPGLPPRSAIVPAFGAFRWIRELPLAPDCRAVVERSVSLPDLKRRLDERAAGAVEIPPGEEGPGRRPARFLIAGSAALVAALVLGLAAARLVGTGGGAGNSPRSTATPAVSSLCGGISVPSSLFQVRSRCGGDTPLRIEFNEDCQRGQACKIERKGGEMLVQANDLVLAMANSSGVALASDDSSRTQGLLLRDGVRQVAWSPDGRYLAFITSEPAGSEGDTALLATQLRVVEASHPGNEGVVASVTEASTAPDWRRRRLVSTQWSADGKSLFILWAARSGGTELYRIDLPFRGDSLNLRVLRVDADPGESIIPATMFSVALTAPDFGVAEGRLGGFATLPDGVMVLQVCEKGSEPACGLGRWDGSAAIMLLSPEPGVVYGPPVAFGEDVALVRFGAGDGDRIVVLTRGGLIKSARALDAGQLGLDRRAFVSPLTALPDLQSVLVGAAGERLVQIPLFAEGETTWGRGALPAWYLASTPPLSLVAQPAVTPFATPAGTSTPTVTATAVPGTPRAAGATDLTGAIAAGSCRVGSNLVITVRNLGPGAVSGRDLLIRIDGADGTVRATIPLRGLSLAPGESVDAPTSYVVQERITVIIDYPNAFNDPDPFNNRVPCSP